jgi:predicted nucleic acid-binding protein
VIIFDTSIWIEYLRGKDQSIVETVTEYLHDDKVIALSPVFGELLQGAKGSKEESDILAFWQNLPKHDEENLMIRAGLLSLRHKLWSKGIGLIDASILYSALETGFEIWSKDDNLNKAAKTLGIRIN